MALENIIKVQRFTAQPDVPFLIGINQSILLMPVFKWDGTHYVDATGDYDMCMAENGLTLEFINRLPAPQEFAYRFIPPSWFLARLGKAGR